MVGRQVAGRVPAGRVALVVQNLRRRHVHVLPAGLAEPIAEVDVLHVHEVALVEPDISSNAAAVATGTSRTTSRRGVRWARAAPAGTRPSTGWISTPGRPPRACRRGSGLAGASPTDTSRRPDHGSAGRAHRRVASVRRPPAGCRCCAAPTARRDWPRRRTRSRPMPQVFGDTEVHGAAVAQIGAGAQQPGVRIAVQRFFGCAVRRPVVGHDDRHRPIGGVRQRGQEPIEMWSRRIRHRHHNQFVAHAMETSSSLTA